MITEITSHCIFLDGPVRSNFFKIYKGISIIVDNDQRDTAHMHFAIRTKKKNNLIFKTRDEEMFSLVFNETDCSIKLNADQNPKNKSLKTLFLECEEYDEIKKALPHFMEKCGCKFKRIETPDSLILEIKD